LLAFLSTQDVCHPAGRPSLRAIVNVTGNVTVGRFSDVHQWPVLGVHRGARRTATPPPDSYDNALAETIFGLFKTEVIWPNGPWRSIEEVEFATLEWVDWFNNRRLLEPIGDIPPAEFEAMYYERLEGPTNEVGLN